MLDFAQIFNRKGHVLWERSWCKTKGSPVNALIHDVLLEERGGEREFKTGTYTLKWTLANELGLVFVAVYQSILPLYYIDQLLEMVKEAFLAMFKDSLELSRFALLLRERLTENRSRNYDFDGEFERLQMDAQKRFGKRPSRKPKVSKPIKTAPKLPLKKPSEAVEESEEGCASPIEDARAKLKAGDMGPRGRRRGGTRSPPPSSSAKVKKEKPKRVKESRTWGDTRLSAEQAAKLDCSGDTGTPSDEALERDLAEVRSTYLGDGGKSEMDVVEEYDWEEEEESEEEASVTAKPKKKKKKGWFGRSVGGIFKRITGNNVLEDDDVEPVLADLKNRLMAANVAEEVSEEVVSSVKASLIGKKLGTWQRTGTRVREALEDALTRILTPRRSIDVLRAVREAKAAGKVYKIVFIGVNGVGKSTSLAKVAYYLQQNGLNVLIAACDTFRSGAVEQLEVHSKCLGVPVFSKGYDKDAASVARAAVKQATETGVDVVLIDTAGRMQNNDPLMCALAKLVTVNDPDLVLFVGEALVGNDGVDQLGKFNESLIDKCEGSPHQVDGVVLTKFDTVDQKVGAAVSMVHTTGVPIVFVGTGQKYTHLRRLNVKMVVKALFS